MRHSLIYIFLTCASAFCTSMQNAGAQQDFRTAVETAPYLSFSNPASLGSFSLKKIATAELSATKEDGGLHPIAGSGDAIKAVAGTEAYVRMSDRVAFHGKLSYSYLAGKEMSGPVLMEPEYNPVNFLETSLENPGAKHKEMYGLVGDMAYSISDAWSIGMGVDYSTGDQTKVKDPRFLNKWMDLRLTPGVFFRPSEAFGLGLSFRYRNTLEMVQGGVFGTSEKPYFVSVDKGNFFGTSEELAGDYNYLPTSVSRPMYNDFIGGSLQMSAGRRVHIDNELSFLSRDGYYGRRSSSTPTFFEFGGIELSYDGSLLIPASDNLHKIAWKASYKTLGNDENLFKYVTPTGQNTVVEYIAQNHIMDRIVMDAALSYDAWMGLSGLHPSLAYGASAGFHRTESKVELYPLYRNHDHMRVNAEAYAEKSFFSSNGYFTARIAASYLSGSGTVAEDGAHIQVSSTSLRSFDQYMLRQFEYDTAARAGGALSFRYTRQIKTGLSAYVSFSNSFTSLIKAAEHLDGRSRNISVLTVGCSF